MATYLWYIHSNIYAFTYSFKSLLFVNGNNRKCVVHCFCSFTFFPVRGTMQGHRMPCAFVRMVNDLRLWKGDRSFITFLVAFWPLRFATCLLKSARQVAGLVLRQCLFGASNDNCDTFYHCIAFSPPRKWKFFFSLLLTLSPFPAYNNYARHHQWSRCLVRA